MNFVLKSYKFMKLKKTPIQKSICYSLFALALLCIGCSKSEKSQPETSAAAPSPAASAPAPVDKSTVGAIAGIVVFKGSPMKFPAIDMTQDPTCPTDPQTPDVMLVNKGKLANVFVYVKDGLGPMALPAPTQPAVLDQKGCRYAPHVMGLMVGQPLKIVCAGAESIADILWIAKPDSPMSSIKDIVGKKIGYTSPGSVTNMLILMAMKAQGIDATSVTLVPAGGIGANLTAVLSGAIDAGMTGEPVWSQEKSKVKPVFWTKDVLPPDMTQTVGIVTDELAKAGPEKIRAIIAGRREGVKYIEAHPDEAADIVAKTYNIDAALTREVFKHFLDIKYWSEGALNYAAMDRMVEGLKIVGKLKEPIDWQKVTDLSFLPQDLQARTH